MRVNAGVRGFIVIVATAVLIPAAVWGLSPLKAQKSKESTSLKARKAAIHASRTRERARRAAEMARHPLPALSPAAQSLVTPMATASCVSLTNPGFEAGDLTGWTVDGTNDAPVVTNTFSHSGTYSAALGNFSPGDESYEPDGDSSFYQTVTVPSGNSMLGFWYWPYSTDDIEYDWQAVYIEDISGNILDTAMLQCSDSEFWVHRMFDLTPYAGQTIRIEFLVHQDGYGDDTGMYVDDVTICPLPQQTDCITLTNPGFESGDLTGWTVDGTNDAPVVTSDYSHSGSYSAALGNFGGDESYEPDGDSSFYQMVALPAGRYRLNFWYWPYSTDSIEYDWQAVYVEDASGNVIGTLMLRCDDYETWQYASLDLTPYSGQTVRIEFLVHQDEAEDPTGMYVDDVSICPAPEATTCMDLSNEGFESGDFTGWTVDGFDDAPTVTSTYSHSGVYSAQLGNFGENDGYEPEGDSSFYQTVTVPAGTWRLGFWVWPYTDDDIEYDWQAVYIEDTSGNVLATAMFQCTNGQGWQYHTFDLTPFAGQMVRIEFVVYQDGDESPTGMYVDDVTICGTSPFNMAFHDDGNTSALCVDSTTGTFQWSAAGGKTFTGTLNVYNGGTMYWSRPGASQYVYLYYDPNGHTAWGYLYDYTTGLYSSLYDSNTLNDPPGCGVALPPV